MGGSCVITNQPCGLVNVLKRPNEVVGFQINGTTKIISLRSQYRVAGGQNMFSQDL